VIIKRTKNTLIMLLCMLAFALISAQKIPSVSIADLVEPQATLKGAVDEKGTFIQHAVFKPWTPVDAYHSQGELFARLCEDYEASQPWTESTPIPTRSKAPAVVEEKPAIPKPTVIAKKDHDIVIKKTTKAELVTPWTKKRAERDDPLGLLSR